MCNNVFDNLLTNIKSSESKYWSKNDLLKIVYSLRNDCNEITKKEKLDIQSKLLSKISHFWRQPLNSISLSLQINQQYVDNNNLNYSKEDMLNNIEKCLIEISKLSTQLTNCSKDIVLSYEETKKIDINIEIPLILQKMKKDFYNLNFEVTFINNQKKHILINETIKNFEFTFVSILNHLIISSNNIKKKLIKIIIDKDLHSNILIKIYNNHGRLNNYELESIFYPYLKHDNDNLNTPDLSLFNLYKAFNKNNNIKVKNHKNGYVFILTYKI